MTDIKTLPEREVVPGFHGRFVYSPSVTVAFWRVDKGAEVPDHAHVHEQIVNVMAGEFDLTVEGEVMHLVAGQVVVIPPNVPHSGKAVTACTLIDIFHPVRDDYR